MFMIDDKQIKFLPVKVRKMLRQNYKKMPYYKQGCHNTMTEDFVMRLPRTITHSQHLNALSKTMSPTSQNFKKQNLHHIYNVFNYTREIMKPKFTMLTIEEDIDHVK